jgi:hypothetical protein
MTVKKCPCGIMTTTKTIKILGRQIWGIKNILFFNCQCGSTLVFTSKVKGK